MALSCQIDQLLLMGESLKAMIAVFVVGWNANLGNCLITLVELWGIYQGLLIAKNKGIKNIWLEISSSHFYYFISHGVLDTHVYVSLVDAAGNMITKGDWNVEVSPLYREANVCADKLAKYGYTLHLGVVVFDRLPPFLSQEFLSNSSRTCRPRIVHL